MLMEKVVLVVVVSQQLKWHTIFLSRLLFNRSLLRPVAENGDFVYSNVTGNSAGWLSTV